MTRYLQEHLGIDETAAHQLRVHYWRRYGATLLGMIQHHAIDPHDFLKRTHPFPDMTQFVRPNAKLVGTVRRLPGTKLLFTNAPAHYAHAVIKALGLHRVLDGVIAVEAMRFGSRWQPKPSRPMLARTLARLRLPARQAVLVEDSVENLVSARSLGLRTVFVQGFARAHVRRVQPLGLRPYSMSRGRPVAVDHKLQSVLTLARSGVVRRLPDV